MITIITDSTIPIFLTLQHPLGLILALTVLACLIQREVLSEADAERRKRFVDALSVLLIPLIIVLLLLILFISGDALA